MGHYGAVTFTMARRGKPRREEQELPPYIQKALILRAGGANWVTCAEAVGTSTNNLRKWRSHPDAKGFLDEAIRQNMEEAHQLFSDAAPKLASRLIALGLDPKVKGYTAVSAISECFKILQVGFVDREQRAQLEAIRETLEGLEGGSPEVIDV